MAQNVEQKKKRVLSNLREYRIANYSCKKSGVSTSTYYRWRHDDPLFDMQCKEAIEEGTRRISDLAESVVVGKVQKGDVKIAIYWLERHHADYKPTLKARAEVTKEDQEFMWGGLADMLLAAREVNRRETEGHNKKDGA